MWIVRGQLHPLRLAGMLPEQRDAILAGKAVQFDKLPKHIPERAVVMIGRDDLFPYRIELWRRLKPEKKTLGIRSPPPVDTLLLAVELYEVQLDVPLDPRQFAYNPGAVQPVDNTANFLRSIGLKPELEAKAPAKPPAALDHSPVLKSWV